MKKITLLSFCLCCTVAAIAQVPSQMGLVGDYPFSNNAKDISLSKNDGQVYGATLTKDRFGKENSAYYFDGLSYITFSAKNIDNNYYSISAWVNVQAAPSTVAKASVILGIGNVGADQNVFIENELGFGITSYVENRPVPLAVVVGPMPSLNTWYHLTVTRGDTYIKFYINGELRGTTVSQNSTASFTPNPLGTIGARHGKLFQTFNGTIDDIKIYSRALAEAEVVTLHKAEVITANDDFESSSPITVLQNNLEKNKFKLQTEHNFSGEVLITNLQGQILFETKILNLNGSQNIEIYSSYKGLCLLSITNELGQSLKKKFILE